MTVALLGLLVLLALPVGLLAQSNEAEDQVQRAMTFVERCSEATEQLNTGRTAEALATFRELTARYGDLDTDGQAALGVGDALAALGQRDEARTAYETAAEHNPALAPLLRHRLLELDLAGSISPEVLLRIRTALAGEPAGVAGWYLGRALQKRAGQLLTEAADQFRLATDDRIMPLSCYAAGPHLASLEELRTQLDAVVANLETAWQRVRLAAPTPAGETEYSREPAPTADLQAAWKVLLPDGTQVRFTAQRIAGNAAMKVAADDRPIALTPIQAELIRQHQSRINLILLDALARQSQSAIAIPERKEP